MDEVSRLYLYLTAICLFISEDSVNNLKNESNELNFTFAS